MSAFTCSYCGKPNNDSDRGLTVYAKACVECWRVVRAEIVKTIQPHRVQLSYPSYPEGDRAVSLQILNDKYEELAAFDFTPRQWVDLLSTLCVTATPTTTLEVEREIRKKLRLLK